MKIRKIEYQICGKKKFQIKKGSKMNVSYVCIRQQTTTKKKVKMF